MCHTRAGAFRRCKDMVDRMGISQQWHDFQAEYYRKLDAIMEWEIEFN